MRELLVAAAIKELPGIIAMLRERAMREDPAGQGPTSEEVIMAFLQACTSSLAKDAAWLAAHPPTADPQ